MIALPSGSNIVFVIAFLALTLVLIVAGWSKSTRL